MVLDKPCGSTEPKEAFKKENRKQKRVSRLKFLKAFSIYFPHIHLNEVRRDSFALTAS